MLKIRLQRIGRKHEPVFRLVVIDSKEGPKSGKALEVLGSYDSRRSGKAVIEESRIKHWLAQGAKLSDTAHNMLVGKRIITGPKRGVVLPKKAIQTKPTEGESAAKKDETKEEADAKNKNQPGNEHHEALNRAADKISKVTSEETEKEVKITS